MTKSDQEIIDETLDNALDIGKVTHQLINLEMVSGQLGEVTLYLRHTAKEVENDDDAGASDAGLAAAEQYAEQMLGTCFFNGRRSSVTEVWSSGRGRADSTADRLYEHLSCKGLRDTDERLTAGNLGNLKDLPESEKLAAIVNDPRQFNIYADSAERLASFMGERRDTTETCIRLAIGHSPHYNLLPAFTLQHHTYIDNILGQIEGDEGPEFFGQNIKPEKMLQQLGKNPRIMEKGEFHYHHNVIPPLNGFAVVEISMPDYEEHNARNPLYVAKYALVDNTGTYFLQTAAISGLRELRRLEQEKQP